MLFVFLAIVVILVSGFISLFDVTFSQPGSDEQMAIKNLLSGEGLQFMITSVIDNLSGSSHLALF